MPDERATGADGVVASAGGASRIGLTAGRVPAAAGGENVRATVRVASASAGACEATDFAASAVSGLAALLSSFFRSSPREFPAGAEAPEGFSVGGFSGEAFSAADDAGAGAFEPPA
jgi:hypothetical protein